MSKFPKIKGLRWLCEDFPDLVAVEVSLIDKVIQAMDIPGMEVPEIKSEMNIDLSKIAAVSVWYSEGAELPSETECRVDIDGVASFIADMTVKDLTEAWIFYKYFNYSRR